MMTALPGCPETFELSQGSQQGQEGQSYEELERHQKVRFIREGEIVAIPSGIVHWVHNNGDSSLVAVILLDTSNHLNQLDRNPRVTKKLVQYGFIMDLLRDMPFCYTSCLIFG